MELHDRLTDLAARVGGPLLGFDTSGPVTAFCTVGWNDGDVLETAVVDAELPSEALADALAAEFARTGVRPADLKAVVLGLGPGSFTGLRVGLAMAKGMALGAATPLYGVSSLAMLAASYGAGRIALAQDARRGEIFSALYLVDEQGAVSCEIADAVRAPEEFVEVLRGQKEAPTLLAGDRATALGIADIATAAWQPPRVAAGLGLAAERIVKGEGDSAATLRPHYLRVSEAERQQMQS